MSDAGGQEQLQKKGDVRERPRTRQNHNPESQGTQLPWDRPHCLKPWIVNYLLKYKDVDTRNAALHGQILEVLSETEALCQDEQCPAAVLHLADGHHYIRAVISARAVQRTEGAQLQTGFSSLLGSIIILKNFRVCFKEEAKVDDCEFYLVVDYFCVTPTKRQRMELLSCNQELSVLQKLRNLWQTRLTAQLFSCTEASISQVLAELNRDQLGILKQNAKDCLDLLDPNKLPAPEQACPDTTWQAVLKAEKGCKGVFMVPGNFLVISAEDDAMLCHSYLPKPSQVMPRSSNSDISLDEASFLSAAESGNLNGSPKNPWDGLQSMSVTLTTTSNKVAVTQPSTPSTEYTPLARTAWEATPSDSSTPDVLDPPPISLQHEPVQTVSPSLLLSHNVIPHMESVSRGPEAVMSTTASDLDKTLDAASNSIPCGQLFSNAGCSYPSWCPSFSLPPSMGLSAVAKPQDVGQGSLSHSGWDGEEEGGAGERAMVLCRRRVVTKRKQVVQNKKDLVEVLPDPCQGKSCTMDFPPASDMNPTLETLKTCLEFVSDNQAKKSQVEEVRMARTGLTCPPAQPSHTVRPPGRGSEPASAELSSRSESPSCSNWLGAQQRKHLRGAPFHYAYEAPSPDIHTQVQATRLSRAMLGWACWVFGKVQQLES